MATIRKFRTVAILPALAKSFMHNKTPALIGGGLFLFVDVVFIVCYDILCIFIIWWCNVNRKEIDILKGLGIIIVVIGHVFSPFSWFPPYSFHMPLFIFISGCLYNQKYELDQKLFFRKRLKSLILPYFLYNLFYMIITFLIYCIYDVKLAAAEIISFDNLIVQPFINGHQFRLFSAGWFIIELLIIQVFFINFHIALKKITNNINLQAFIFILIAILGIYLGNHGFNSGWKLVITRTLFGVPFYFFGFYYMNKISKINIFKTEWLLLVFVFQVFSIYKYKDISFIMAWGDFNGNRFLPLLTSINGIYLYMFISKALSRLLPDNDILEIIGRNTLHILANHLFIFVIINFIFVYYHKIDITNLQSIYNPEKYWMLYCSLGFLAPTLISVLIKKIFTNKTRTTYIN